MKTIHKTIINGTVYNPHDNNGIKKIVDDFVPSASGRNHIPYGNSKDNPPAVMIPERDLFPSSGMTDRFAGNSDLVLREINGSGCVNGIYVIPKSIIEKWRAQYNKRHPDGNNAMSDVFVNGDGTQTYVTYNPKFSTVRIEWKQLPQFKEFGRDGDSLEKIHHPADASAPLF